MGTRILEQTNSYKAGTVSTAGLFAPLLPGLAKVWQTPRFDLHETPNSAVAMLELSQDGKRVFCIYVSQQSGRHMVEMSGADGARLPIALQHCSDHFDCWFRGKPETVKIIKRNSWRRRSCRQSQESYDG
jgi:hypothetical protein